MSDITYTYRREHDVTCARCGREQRTVSDLTFDGEDNIETVVFYCKACGKKNTIWVE